MQQSSLMRQCGLCAAPHAAFVPAIPLRAQRRQRLQLRAQQSDTTASKYRVSLFDAFRFDGAGPEIVNGRLCMIGFVAGAAVEVQTAEPLAQQAMHMSPLTIAGLLLVVYASLVPILKGVKNEAFGPFSPASERINARAAMLGFAVVLALESRAGVCFF